VVVVVGVAVLLLLSGWSKAAVMVSLMGVVGVAGMLFSMDWKAVVVALFEFKCLILSATSWLTKEVHEDSFLDGDVSSAVVLLLLVVVCDASFMLSVASFGNV
jgi:hypothetical protein